MDTAKTYGIQNVINCLWSDNGSECSKFSALPGIVYFAYKTMNKSMENVKADFGALTGAKFDGFVSLDIPGTVMGKYTNDTTAPTAYFCITILFPDSSIVT